MEVFKAAKDHVRKLHMQGTSAVGVVINCRWGKHRSVAMAEDLAADLRLYPSTTVQVLHLERPRWDRLDRAWRGHRAREGVPWPLRGESLMAEGFEDHPPALANDILSLHA